MFHWTIALKGVHELYYHAAAVVVGHKLYSFGGFKNYRIEVHIFNTLSLRWRKLPSVTKRRGESPFGPTQLWGHTAVLVEEPEIAYIWGGYPYSNVLYAFNVDAHRWFKPKVSGTIPRARTYHSACVLEKVIYVYGGNTRPTGYTNDMYKLDTTNMVWSLINTRGTPPAPSDGHSATIIGTKMFVFGGRDQNYHINSMRVFDTETNCWQSTPSGNLIPKGRGYHSAFAYNGELCVFGGNKGNRSFNDLWKFSPEAFSWKQVEPKGKGPRWMQGMCCCMVGDRIIVFGECNKGNGDLYVLDLQPTLKTLCKLSVIHYGLKWSELPHDIKWELTTMTTNRKK